MSDHFYKAFEDRYRGSHKEIQNRLNVYLPYVLPLAGVYPDALAVDLGCGRGEWLDLLYQHQILGLGVDLNAAMLATCLAQGLRVENAEAVGFLERQANESALVITAFHLVEHLDFDVLRQLVYQAHRVLKPGGLLIMETPNPENIMVATQGFYLDPTHQRPIPPSLLSFIPEYEGYAQIKILRLQEKPGVQESVALTLNDVLGGSSPDYAVMAQKKTDDLTRHLLDQQWPKVHGVSGQALAEIFRHQKDEWATLIKDEVIQTKNQINTLLEGAEKTWIKLDGTQKQIHDICVDFHSASSKVNDEILAIREHLIQMQNDFRRLEINSIQKLNNIYQSKSWKLTAPLRWLQLQHARLNEHGIKSRLKSFVKKIIKLMMSHVLNFSPKNSKWRKFFIKCAKSLGQYDRLVKWNYEDFKSDSPKHIPATEIEPTQVDMTKEARVMFARLKKAIETREQSDAHRH